MLNNFPYMDIQNVLADHYELLEERIENTAPHADIQNTLADYHETK